MKKILKTIALGLLIFSPSIVLASGVDAGLGSISSLFPHVGLSGSQSVSDLIYSVIMILLFLSGIIAILFIIVGGFWYITSAGNAEQAEKGQTTLVNAIIGIVIIVLSYVIINVIVNLVGNNQV